jgi:hypothetical protein
VIYSPCLSFCLLETSGKWSHVYFSFSECTDAIEYYSALKEQDILPHGTIRMTPEDVMLSEISQTQDK